MVPKLNLKLSATSLVLFVITSDKEKFKGPTAVSQSIPIPIELRISLPSSMEES